MQLHRIPFQQNKFANEFLTCIDLLSATTTIPGYTAALVIT